jgi:serine/threonine-protein kinase
VFGSDIYALGVTCLYLLTAKAPLDFDSDRQTGELLWQDSVQLSKPFAQILDKMLKVSPQERYQSASAILEALDWESPHDNLARCLVMQNQLQTANQDDSNSTSYRSPTAKAAIAIREWKHRIQQKQGRRQSRRIQSLLGESENSD